jgi:hypothetical protein
VCLLTEAEATGGDPAGAASAARDAPLIMAPAPFAGASLRRVDLRVSRAETTYEIAKSGRDFEDEENDEKSEKRKTVKKRRVYVAECSGGGAGGAIPIPPWCVSRLAEALCDEQAENVVGSFRALGASAALNAAVAAAAGPVPGDEADDVAIPREKKTKDAETFQEGGGAFTPRERERIRSSSRLGARGVERVERADGVWYVNPESASRNAR